MIYLIMKNEHQIIMSNSKRIAKNTLFLYMRSVAVLIISLYTSRIILQALGVEDYGIYNVVGGVISMIGFLNASLTNTYQRYYNYEMGRNNISAVMKYFQSALGAQLLMAFVILIVAESVGVWFVSTQLTIPDGREFAAMCVYQVSVLSLILVMLQVPFSALIISYERMGVFAYISILDAVLKLGIVLMLLYLTGDRLIIYSIFMLAVSVINFLLYFCYCRRYLSIVRICVSWDKGRLKSMFNFSSWVVFDSLASTLKSNGLNMLLNIFFGPIVNAAYGLSHHVMTAVSQFVVNFQTAFRPQLTKLYAANDYPAMYKLLYSATKLSFYLMLILSLPLIFEASFILKIWLGNNVPEHTVAFVRFVLVISWISSFANPLSGIAYATGKVKNFVLFVSTITLLILPISWLILKMGAKPEAVFMVSMSMLLLAQVSRMVTLKKLLPFSILKYTRRVLIPCTLVLLISIIVPCVLTKVMEQNVLRLFLCCTLTVLGTCTAVWLLGLESMEKSMVMGRLKDLKSKFKNVKNSIYDKHQ